MDFYVLLGVDSNATTADIKRAYRRLSRRYHPGVNPGDRAAEALFQQISEAYETLVDPQRRLKYDANGARSRETTADRTFEFSGFDFSVRAQGAQAATFTELFADVLHPTGAGTAPEHGADLNASLTVRFVEAVQGARRQVIVTRQEACSACRGRGFVQTSEGRCGHCHATGKVRWARGHMVFSKPCAACSGTGKLRQQRCEVCGGHGRVVRSEAVLVDVPAGTADGARLRIAGKGHAGRNGGRTGDLYVTVHVEPHQFFQRQGEDLHVRVPLAVHEAVLGTRIEVPSLDGPVRLRVPPGTQAGHRFRLKGRGVPTPSGIRGDLIIEVALVLPPVVDERSKELMREFGRLYNGDVRRDLTV
ncbi:MAG: J domain-containing protein [Vicinamibacterales bacterium]